MSDYSNDHWLKDQMRDEQQSKSLYDPVNGCVRGRPSDMKDFFNAPLGIPIKPDLWSIDKFLVLNIIDALENGLENTHSVLAEHDRSLGRNTTKNRNWAETLESQIRLMEDCLKKLREMRVMHETSYP